MAELEHHLPPLLVLMQLRQIEVLVVAAVAPQDQPVVL
jgi:hypothetical protein